MKTRNIREVKKKTRKMNKVELAILDIFDILVKLGKKIDRVGAMVDSLKYSYAIYTFANKTEKVGDSDDIEEELQKEAQEKLFNKHAKKYRGYTG